MLTAIINVRIFDREFVIQHDTVVIDGPVIKSVSGPVSEGATIDAEGATLLPGLIDSHVHTKIPQLQLVLRFGATTDDGSLDFRAAQRSY